MLSLRQYAYDLAQNLRHILRCDRCGCINRNYDLQRLFILRTGQVKPGGLPAVQLGAGLALFRCDGSHIFLQYALPAEFGRRIQRLDLFKIRSRD